MKWLLPIIALLFVCAPKARAQTIPAPTISKAGCADASTCVVTLSAPVAAGDTVDVLSCTVNATPIASVSGIGTVVDDAFRAGLVFDKYCFGVHTFTAIATSGSLTVTFTPTVGGPTTTGGANVFVFDYAVTGGTPVADSQLGNSPTSVTSPFAGSQLTLTCSTCAVDEIAVSANNVTAVSSPWSSNAAFLTTQTGAGAAALVGVSNMTAPNWTATSPSYGIGGGFAFGFGSRAPVNFGVIDTTAGTSGSVVTTTDLAAETFGTTGGPIQSSCSGSNEERSCWTVTNTGSALTYGTGTAPISPLFNPRLGEGGNLYNDSSSLVFNYDTTLGDGNLDFANMFFPYEAYGTGVGLNGVALATIRMSTTIIGTDSMNMDPFSLYGSVIGAGDGGESFAGVNLIPNGTNVTIDLEGATTGPGHYNLVTGNVYDWAIMYVQSGTCEMEVYNVNADGTEGSELSTVSTVPCQNGPPIKVGFGDLLANAKTHGRNVKYWDLRYCFVGCSTAQFPLLDPAHLTDGVISPTNATDYTFAGFNGGVLPDASWPFCNGTPLAAGSYLAATITSSLNACPPFTRYQLGSGNFNINTDASDVMVPSYVAIVGQGAKNTHVFGTGTGTAPQCSQLSQVFCMSAGGNYTQSPGTVYNITAGFNKGSTQITVSGSPTPAISPIPALVWIDQDNTGFTGSSGTPTGCAIDNNQFFVAEDVYATSGCNNPNGASQDGPDSGGSRPERDELEPHTVTAVNGSVLTITPPIVGPAYSSGLSPQMWISTPLYQLGVENMSIDVSASGAATGCVGGFNIYQWWVSGVSCFQNKNRAFNFLQGVNGIFQQNYWYGSTGTLPSNYGLRLSATGFNLIQDNICQNIQGGCFFNDGASTTNVFLGNYCTRENSSGDLVPCITEHSMAVYDEAEHNIGSGFSGDDTHASSGFQALFRNLWKGWESNTSANLGQYTNAIPLFSYARNYSSVGNVLGTNGYHTSYTSATLNTAVYNLGTGCTGCGTVIPNDTHVALTTMKWGVYDVSTNAVRWCGSSADPDYSTTCGSVSEIPTGLSFYSQSLPTKGDPGAGMSGLPASFYYQTKPAWYGSIAWPEIGPEVTTGTLVECGNGSGLNTVGQMNGEAATASGQCPVTGGTAGAWGGHAFANPAMNCFLNVMGGVPDGSGSALTFNAADCYPPGTGPTTTPAPCVTCFVDAPHAPPIAIFTKLVFKIRGIYEKAFTGDRRVAAVRGSAVARANNGS